MYNTCIFNPTLLAVHETPFRDSTKKNLIAGLELTITFLTELINDAYSLQFNGTPFLSAMKRQAFSAVRFSRTNTFPTLLNQSPRQSDFIRTDNGETLHVPYGFIVCDNVSSFSNATLVFFQRQLIPADALHNKQMRVKLYFDNQNPIYADLLPPSPFI